MKKHNKEGRMIWSGKTAGDPGSKRARKPRSRSMGILFVVVFLLTMLLSSTVYAAPTASDIMLQDSAVAENLVSVDGYIWGEILNWGDGYIWDESYGYAWGE